MTFCGFVLSCKLARQIHGTDDALRYTARACRDLVSREHRPLVSRVMRHPEISKWLDLYDDM